MTGAMERRIAGLLRAGMWAAVAVMLAGVVWHPLMQIGVGILVATPIARVAFAAGAFLVARDRAYAAIAGTVLCILLYSLVGGR
jgi:uncharacterized membrane protein